MVEVMGGVDLLVWFDGYVDWGQMVVGFLGELQS